MSKTERPPHKWVAERIGFSIAGVSLLRAGLRRPSIPTMERIEKAFGWSMSDQINARKHYSASLEKTLEEAYSTDLTSRQTQ